MAKNEGGSAEPMDVLTRLTLALEAMTQRQQSSPETITVIQTLTDAVNRMSENQIAGAEKVADATMRAQRPSNQVVPMCSPLNPRGELLGAEYQKPRLKCPMMVPFVADNDSITREEVELLNLLEPGTYAVKRVDGTVIKVDIKVDYALDEVTPSRLLLNHDTAFNQESFRLMPGMADMYRQILKQSKNEQTRHEAAGVLTMDEEYALIAAGKLSVSK